MSFYSSESCHLSEYTLKWFNLVGFLTHVQKISPLLNKCEVWVSREAICYIFLLVFLLDFLKWKTWKQKYADSRLFLDNIIMFNVKDDNVWKHFK